MQVTWYVAAAWMAQGDVYDRQGDLVASLALFRREVTTEDVLASRVVCEPLHLHMLCSPNEGASAVVLQKATATEFAACWMSWAVRLVAGSSV